jgi:hypothetical protein
MIRLVSESFGFFLWQKATQALQLNLSSEYPLIAAQRQWWPAAYRLKRRLSICHRRFDRLAVMAMR